MVKRFAHGEESGVDHVRAGARFFATVASDFAVAQPTRLWRVLPHRFPVEDATGESLSQGLAIHSLNSGSWCPKRSCGEGVGLTRDRTMAFCSYQS